MKKKGFTRLKIGITIVSLIVAIITKSDIDWSNLLNNCFELSLAKELIYDLSVGVFSAMILVWFIDEIGNRIQERQSQEKEKATIRRFDKVLQQYIEQYITMFYTRPFGKSCGRLLPKDVTWRRYRRKSCSPVYISLRTNERRAKTNSTIPR